MKKLLKNKVFGSMNSAWVHCSQLTWSNSVAGTQKKKSQKTQTQLFIIRIQTHTMDPFGLNLLLLKLKTENTVAK